MEKFTLKKELTSCRVDKRLLAQIENFFLTQVARSFKKEIENMMYLMEIKNPAELRTFSIALGDRTGSRELASMTEFKEDLLDPAIERASIHLRLGRPELIDLAVVFPKTGPPFMEMTTFSKRVHQAGTQIHQKLAAILENWRNYNWLVHNRAFQGGLILLIPAIVVACGLLASLDHPTLYFAQGWLLLLSGALSWILTRIFPLTSFKTRRRLNLRVLGHLALFAATVAAIAAYLTLLFFELQRLGR